MKVSAVELLKLMGVYEMDQAQFAANAGIELHTFNKFFDALYTKPSEETLTKLEQVLGRECFEKITLNDNDKEQAYYSESEVQTIGVKAAAIAAEFKQKIS